MTPALRKTERVPASLIDPLIQQIRQIMGCSQADALRLIGYRSSSGTYWAEKGAPAVALHAARNVLADLQSSTMLTPPGTPAPELPMPAPPAPANGLDHTPGLLTVEEPQAEALILEHPEPPEPLLSFDECSALFGMLATGLPLPEEMRRRLLGKLALELAR